MIFFVQVNKETKRVEGYSSVKLEDENFIEIEVDSNNLEYEELFKSPMIFIYQDSNFIKDTEFQDKLIKQDSNNLSDSQKIFNLSKKLASSELENMKKDTIINSLARQVALNKINIMNIAKKGSELHE